MKPYLIGIAGPSGSGKSELAAMLSGRLQSPGVVSLDSYYLPMDHLPLDQRALVNFDRPEALDWHLIRAHIARLQEGLSIDEPVYRFDLHTRAFETRRIQPSGFVLIEGLFALYDPQVRAALDLKIYVETPDDVCLQRRIARDVVQRGRTAESVIAQYEATVRPMARQFVHPTSSHAGLVLSGEQPLEFSWIAVQEFIPASIVVPTAETQIAGAARIPSESA